MEKESEIQEYKISEIEILLRGMKMIEKNIEYIKTNQ